MNNSMQRVFARHSFRILAAVLLTLAIPSLWKGMTRADVYFDFDVYHRTALRLFRLEWTSIWNLVLDGNCPYRYSPWTLIFVAPFGALPLPAARAAFILIAALLFIAGVRVLMKTAEHFRQEGAGLAAALATLFSVRYILDTYRMGQVNGLLFFCFALSFSGLVMNLPARAAFSSTTAALFKIGPGVSLLPSLFAFPFRTLAHWFARVVLVLAGSVFAIALVRMGTSSETFFQSLARLFSEWWPMVAGDSQFFEAGHYGSQSLKSAILRAGLGKLSIPALDRIWLAVVAVFLGVTSIALFRARARLQEFRIGSLASSLSILLFVLCMPHTFKFNCSALILPFFALLMINRKDPVVWALGILQLVFSRDLVGGENYDWIYKNSLPLMTYLGIYGWTLYRFHQAQSQAPEAKI